MLPRRSIKISIGIRETTKWGLPQAARGPAGVRRADLRRPRLTRIRGVRRVVQDMCPKPKRMSLEYVLGHVY